MVSRLRPLDVVVSFPERNYRLGDTIDLTIAITPHRDCDIREGRVDLMLEERWTETVTRTIEKPIDIGGGRGMSGSFSQVGTETETEQSEKKLKEKTAHSSVVFLEGARVISGRGERYRVTLEVRPDRPAHIGVAKTRWWLQTVIDVAGARDIKPRSKIAIAV